MLVVTVGRDIVSVSPKRRRGAGRLSFFRDPPPPLLGTCGARVVSSVPPVGARSRENTADEEETDFVSTGDDFVSIEHDFPPTGPRKALERGTESDCCP